MSINVFVGTPGHICHMFLPAPLLPPPRRLACRLLRLSAPLHQRILAAVVNPLLDQLLDEDDRQALSGRRLSLRLRDVDHAWIVMLRGDRFQVLDAADARPDAEISGDTGDFLSLLLGREDPDTLFFQRRLNLEGDVDLSLRARNILDRFDLHAPLAALLHRLRAVRLTY